jgi:hypothetical protein
MHYQGWSQQGANAMKKAFRMKKTVGGLVLAGALLINTAPVKAQDYGYAGGYNYAPAGQLDSLVSRIALYPDPLLAQIFAAAAFPDQIAAAAQGSPGPFDPSVEALMQYPSVLQMMASDPGWTQALGEAVMQNQDAVMDAIQNLRREAQQYGYLRSGPQMQVLNEGGYIYIQPVGGYMYVPMYDPYVVFARPRPGFFVGGAIRFGTGFHWLGGYNRFDWRSHRVVINRRVWTPPVHRTFVQRPPERRFNPQPAFRQQRNFGPPRQMEQRNFNAPRQTEQRNFNAPRQTEQRNFNAPRQTEQRNFNAPRQTEQRNFNAPRQMERQRSFTPQPRNESGHFERGGGRRGR